MTSAASPTHIKGNPTGWFVGEDQNFEWDIRTNGIPVDITGWTISIRWSRDEGGTSILTKSATQVLPARCRVSVAAADTIGITPDKLFYTLSRTDPGFNQVLDSNWDFLQERVV